MKYLFFGLGPWYGQNIDNVLRSQKDKFQNAVLQIVQTSTTIKVIMTSRETAPYILNTTLGIKYLNLVLKLQYPSWIENFRRCINYGDIVLF